MSAARITLSLLALLAVTPATLAAPNGTPDPVANCANGALIQYNLDYAQCYAIPIEQGPQREMCLTQATVKYSLAVAACGKSSVRASVSPSLKQNLDSAFVRRLRN